MVGLRYPDEVMNPISERIHRGEDKVKIQAETGISTTTLLKHYRLWCEKRGLHPRVGFLNYPIPQAPPVPISVQPEPLADPPSLQPTPPTHKIHAPATARLLFIDIETLPNLLYSFDLYPENGINPAFIVKEKSICCIGWKFLGDEKTKVVSIADFPESLSDPHDDRNILRTIFPIWEQAHAIIGHFSTGFDVPFINGRLLANGLPSLPPVKHIDTYRLAKKTFKNNSNKLDYLGQILDVGRKNKTDATLWVRCAQGDREAIKIMSDYNAQDVTLLESVFIKMLPYVTTGLNLNLLVDEPIQRCGHCASDRLEQHGFELKPQSIRHRFLCLDCGSWNATRPRKD